MVGIFFGQTQIGKIQAIGRDVHVIVGVGTIEQGLAIDTDAAVGVIHGQHAGEIVALLVHIGNDIVVAGALEVNKRDLSLKVS